MTYDIEAALRHALRVRVDGDALMGETARIADLIADGFRADFGESMDLEAVGKALVFTAASLVPLIDPAIPSAVIANMIGLAGENLVRNARARSAEEIDGVLDHFAEQEYVLTWHPLTEGWTEPIRLPLNEHVEWADGIGEFKLEVRTLADEAPEGVR